MICAWLIGLRVVSAESADNPGILTRVWQSQDGLPSNVVRSLVQAEDGYLWVATAEGIARFDGFDFQLIEPEGNLRRTRLVFYRLFAGSGGDVFAATYQGGLFRVRDGCLQRILPNMRSPNPSIVSQVLEDSTGAVFFKRGAEFGRIEADNQVTGVELSESLDAEFQEDFKRQVAGGRAMSAGESPGLKDRMGRAWRVGAVGGLSFGNEGAAGESLDLPRYGKVYAVSEMLEDVEGNVWIASPVHGLARVRQRRIDVLEVSGAGGERAVSVLMQDKANVWWIANRSGGLTRWSPTEARFLEFTNRPVAALFEDSQSRLWGASRDGSVFRYENGEFVRQFTKTEVPSKVRSITEGANGVLWFGGTQGLASLTDETVRRFGEEDGVADYDLTVVHPFPGGKIMAGTTNGAVILGDARGFKTLALPELTQHKWVSGIHCVSEKETWVTTLGGGFYLWDGAQWTCFDVNDGLPDSRLTCVVDDGKGYIWLGSLGGVIRASRRELLAKARDESAPVQWLRLDHSDGMPSRECIGGFQPAGWLGSDGLIWFPTGNGVARVKPGLIEMGKVAPPVYLHSVRANGVEHAGMRETVTTEPGRARLEFRFVGLSLGSPEKVTYRARLAGLDDSWRELGNQRVAAFEAVPPGKYTFEVMAVNGDGLRSAVPARIPVLIRPHIWQSAWFYLSVWVFIVLSAVAVGWAAARVRMKRRIDSLKLRNAREAERSRIARDLHDDLGASLTEISILAALAAEDAGQTALHPALDQLSIKAKHAVGSLDEIVWAVNPREDTLRSLIDYISAFTREFLDIARISLRTDIARDIPDLSLGAPQRHSVFLAIREVLNNIVKHSGASEVQLLVRLSEDMLHLEIQDNGQGFDLEYASAGNGLGNLRMRMREAGGDCKIETSRRKGTVVFFSLPLPQLYKPVL